MRNKSKDMPKKPPKEFMWGIKITFKVPSTTKKEKIEELSKSFDSVFTQFEDVVKDVKASRHDDTVEEIEADIIDVYLSHCCDDQCPSCDLTFLDDDYNFCPYCGQDLNLEVETVPPDEEMAEREKQ